MSPDNTFDAYAPREIAQRVEGLGVAKAKGSAFSVFLLSLLAGAFIALGALFFTVVITDPSTGFGLTRMIGGLAFSLGLILVVVGGAELFTGNNLVAMAWASRLVTTAELARNWAIVYVGNALGALGTVVLVVIGNVDTFADGAVGETARKIGATKAALSIPEALALGVLCNALVCLAVWLAMGGRTVSDKILAIIFPITAFVAIGFEHSIANMFFLTYANALADFGDATLIANSLRNLAFVTIGNIVGGSLLVGGVYWLAYLRGDRAHGQAQSGRTRT